MDKGEIASAQLRGALEDAIALGKAQKASAKKNVWKRLWCWLTHHSGSTPCGMHRVSCNRCGREWMEL